MALPNALNTYNFPDAYDSLVDAFTGTIKYISASTGSNGNTGNSVGAAYLTIDYALAQNTSGTATMFVILEGTYTLTPTSVNGSSVGLTDGGNHREFVCAPGKVIIQHTASGADRDSAIFNMGNINSKIYGAIIKRNNNGRTTNYTVAYFKFNSAKGNFYNCVFSETNANNQWSYQYDNYGYNNLALRNCTFYHLAAPSGNYTNAGTCLTIDSVFNTTVTTGGTETNVLKSQTVNATTYATTGVTTAGVYSGTYAWNGATTFDPGFVAPATVVSGNTINLVYYHTSSSATVAYTITGVITADINGTALTGNMTVTNSSATLSIPTTQFSSGGAKTLTITAGAYSASVSITPKLFVRSANGGTKSLVTRGGILYAVHRFNSSANFTISNADAGATADILIVAGGGSGGNHNTTNANGGGGAGGVLQGTATLAAGTYAVVVGAGGTAIANATVGNGVKGTNSSLGSYIAEGGGGGGSTGVAFSSAAQNGGSGGGNAYGQSGGGVANANATAGGLSVLGFNGGSTSATWTGAGGGGAGGAGVNGSGSSPGGNGGIGITNTWTGSTLYLAGGGGGGGNSSERAGDGFYGGGRGEGTTTYYSYNVYTNEVNATTKGSGIPTAVVNTGGGGGGGSYWAANGGWSTGSGAGGSGIVIVSYEATAGFSAPTSVLSGNTIDISYVHSASSGTVAYTITGVTSQDINGNSLSGNMTVTNSSATLSIPTVSKIATTNTLTITAGAYSISVTISPSFTCEALIIAGGGSGGNHNTTNANGGGGAGGVLQGTAILAAGSYAVVVGAGGTAIANATALNGVKGTNSSFGSLVAEGGGGGGSSGVAFSSAAQNGGSGGGNAYNQSGGGVANANATAGSFSGSTYSGSFNGTSQYLATASSSQLDFGTGDFTIECWVNSTSVANYHPTFLGNVTGWSAGASGHRFNNTGYANKFWFGLNGSAGVSSGDPFMVSSSTFSFNTWYHYALTRSGNTWKMYINGSLEATGTYSGSYNLGYGGTRVGNSAWDGANGYYKGYVSNLRIVKGVTVYTNNFIVPAGPLTATQSSGTNISAITGTQTSLLTLQDATIVDNSTFAATITTNGSVTTSTTTEPFALTVLGFNGGSTSATWTGAGGGGAGGAGVNGSGSSPGGNGGIGITNAWTGSTLYLAGGGGGGGNSSERAGDGFYGGGRGEGTTTYYSYNVYTNEVNATTRGSGIPTAVVNTGGGGGGGSYWAANGGWTTGSGAGGSGRVLIRYAGSPRATGGTITQSGGYTIHQFLTAGTFTTPTPGLNSSHQTTAYWGETISFTYVADVADASTQAYTISGVTSGQISGASLSGNFTFSGSIATVTVALATQSTNTTATMAFVSGGTTFTISISNVTSFTSSVPGTYWGGTITLTAQTRGLTSGGTVPYTISGVTSAQISNASLTGNATNVLAGYGYSTSFNGTTSKLSIPASADFAFGTGSFTIEFWIKTTDGACDIITQTTASAPNWGLIIVSGTLYWQNGYAASSLYYIALTSLTANPTSGSWTHVAITRNGSGSGNLRFWINGVGQTVHAGDDTTNYTGQGPIQISGPGSGYGFFTGNISNLRIVKGVAVYTGNFTVPTSPLTATQSSGTNISAITGTQTSLLCCQSATVIDNSAAARTITNTDVTVSSDAPIGNNELAALGGGTATLAVVTNPSEPILNTATMVITAAGTSRSVVIRTGSPAVSQGYKPSLVSLAYIDTEVTDIHSQDLEAKVSSLVDVGSRVNPVQFSTTVTNIVYIDTEITDIHSQALEAKVSSVIDLNAKLYVLKSDTSIAGFVAAPTFAYSSGEDVKVSASATQVWYI